MSDTAKLKDSTYSPGDRTKQWLKIKTGKVVPAVIAGYLIDKDKSALSALIIAKKNERKYEYLGLVSAGVGPRTVKKILTYGKRTTKSVFAVPPKVNRKGVFRTPSLDQTSIQLRGKIPGIRLFGRGKGIELFQLAQAHQIEGITSQSLIE
jgi:ATP-dependent DNA ligase